MPPNERDSTWRVLSNNLDSFPPLAGSPGSGAGVGRARRRLRGGRVALTLVALTVVGGLIGLGAYQFVLAADQAAGPPGRAVAAAPGNAPPAELVVTDLFGDRAESQNWSGYAATAGGYTAVSATWTVPDLVSSSAPGTDAAWVGIGGVHSGDLIQAGTLRTVMGSGATRQEAWVELLPQGPVTVPLAISPGDSITVSIRQQGPESWLVEFYDVTSGQSYQATRRYASSLSSVEWVAEAPTSGRGRSLPLDDFGTLRFSAASAVRDDQQITIAESGAQPITMITPNGRHLVETSAVGADGASFSVTRTSIPSPSPRRARP